MTTEIKYPFRFIIDDESVSTVFTANTPVDGVTTVTWDEDSNGSEGQVGYPVLAAEEYVKRGLWKPA